MEHTFEQVDSVNPNEAVPNSLKQVRSIEKSIEQVSISKNASEKKNANAAVMKKLNFKAKKLVEAVKKV